MAGRPKAQINLSEAEREQLQAWARRRTTAQALALRSRIVLECARPGTESGSGGSARGHAADGVEVAQSLCAVAAGGLLDAPRPGAPRTIDDARIDAVIAMTLEQQPANATHWSTRTMARGATVANGGQSHLARLRLATASAGDLQALDRPAICRQDARYRWAVPRSADQGHGAVCRREEPDSGAGSNPAAAAVGPRHRRAAHARLRAPWHHLRCLRHLDMATGEVIGAIASAASQQRVSAIPAHHRGQCAGDWTCI